MISHHLFFGAACTNGSSRITFHHLIIRELFLVIISSWLTSKILAELVLIIVRFACLCLTPATYVIITSENSGAIIIRKDFMCITSKYSRGINIEIQAFRMVHKKTGEIYKSQMFGQDCVCTWQMLRCLAKFVYIEGAVAVPCGAIYTRKVDIWRFWPSLCTQERSWDSWPSLCTLRGQWLYLCFFLKVSSASGQWFIPLPCPSTKSVSY